jgi:hypothetical protein
VAVIKSTIKIWAHFCCAKTGLSAPIWPLCGQIPLLSLARFVFYDFSQFSAGKREK